MKKLLLPVLLLLCLNASAQSDAAIAGTWKFFRLIDSSGAAPADLEMARKMFADMAMTFSADGRYRASMMGRSEDGNWAYVGATKTLTMASDRGQTNNVRLLSVSDTALLLMMDRKGGYELRRANTTTQMTPGPKPAAAAPVAVSKEQLARKWYFRRREQPGRTEEQLRIVSELFAGTYFDLRPDGTCRLQLGKMESAGTWKLDTGKGALVLVQEGEEQVWVVRAISADRLELQKGYKDDKWIFTRKP
ncbi:hypothetical protein [Flaviaesturariibacter amylovorans]|uniref:Lipocalin-like domain-containing protein n=1 Tax=Flaviaesturariibacter amylovorans TaxID=1084520 RepID=A0ABP8GLB7_9BACT